MSFLLHFRSRVALGLAAYALLLLACSTTIEAEDYDTSCTMDSDCVTVGVGDVCDCGCGEGAINQADLAQYNDDRGSIECSTDCGPCPELSPAACVDGTCEIVPPTS